MVTGKSNKVWGFNGTRYLFFNPRTITGAALWSFPPIFTTLSALNMLFLHFNIPRQNKHNGSTGVTGRSPCKMIKDASFAVILFPNSDHKWNKEKVTLHLCIERAQLNDEYYVVGNISELGRWKINNKMKRQILSNSQKNLVEDKKLDK